MKPVDSNDPLTGNFMRTDPAIFDLVKASASMETTSDQFIQNGQRS